MNLGLEFIQQTQDSLADLIAKDAKQFSTVVANALNRTASEALDEGRRQWSHTQGITVRDTRFADFMFRLVERAKPNNLQATVGIVGPKAGIITRHITGDVAQSTDPLLGQLYIPTQALRTTPQTVIPKGMYPKALRLIESRSPSGLLPARSRLTARGKLKIQGKRSTFVMISAGGRGIGIFQRIGPSKGDVIELWRYVSTAHVPARFPLGQIINQVVSDRLAINLEGYARLAGILD